MKGEKGLRNVTNKNLLANIGVRWRTLGSARLLQARKNENRG